MRHHGTSRILWLGLLSALTMASCCLNAFTSVRLMGLACALSGLAFGGFQGIVPAITSELFGMAHFATNYSLQQLGPALGARQPRASHAWLCCCWLGLGEWASSHSISVRLAEYRT